MEDSTIKDLTTLEFDLYDNDSDASEECEEEFDDLEFFDKVYDLIHEFRIYFPEMFVNRKSIFWFYEMYLPY